MILIESFNHAIMEQYRFDNISISLINDVRFTPIESSNLLSASKSWKYLDDRKNSYKYLFLELEAFANTRICDSEDLNEINMNDYTYFYGSFGDIYYIFHESNDIMSLPNRASIYNNIIRLELVSDDIMIDVYPSLPSIYKLVS